MKNYVAVVLGILIVAFAGCSSESNPDAEKSGIDTAQAWLKLVDSEKYSESWREAAEYFKSAVSEEKWGMTIRAVRKPLGKVVSRKFKSRKHTTSLPGAPNGEYVIIQYNTTFENKKAAVETITPMLDKDGKWRVSGYYIK